MNTDYTKYMKYKKKYVELKKQIGGTIYIIKGYENEDSKSYITINTTRIYDGDEITITRKNNTTITGNINLDRFSKLDKSLPNPTFITIRINGDLTHINLNDILKMKVKAIEVV